MITAAGTAARAVVVLTATLLRPVVITDADLVPGALVTVWQDDTGRHVVVEPLQADDEASPSLAEAR